MILYPGENVDLLDWENFIECVYIVIDRFDEVIYVGYSRNAHARLSATRLFRDFLFYHISHVIIIENPEKFVLEKQLIQFFQPKLNKVSRVGKRRLSIAL